MKLDGVWRRATADGDGGFALFLPALSEYEVRVFDPASGLIGTAFGTTPASGRGADLTAGLVFRAPTGPD